MFIFPDNVLRVLFCMSHRGRRCTFAYLHTIAHKIFCCFKSLFSVSNFKILCLTMSLLAISVAQMKFSPRRAVCISWTFWGRTPPCGSSSYTVCPAPHCAEGDSNCRFSDFFGESAFICAVLLPMKYWCQQMPTPAGCRLGPKGARSLAATVSQNTALRSIKLEGQRCSLWKLPNVRLWLLMRSYDAMNPA